MSDERQLRALLARAAELPDDVQPTVRPLVERGRRHRAVRAAASVLAAGVVAAAAFALPAVLARPHGTVPGPAAGGGRYPSVVPPAPPRWPSSESGPTARQLTGFRWSSLPPSPLGAVSDPLLTWTGSELVELGGFRGKAQSHEGAVYDPATRRWHRTPDVQADLSNNADGPGAATAWTGRALFVAAPPAPRCRGAGCRPRASLYDPATNSWSTAPVPGRFDGLIPQSAVWTGRAIVLAAVNAAGGRLAIGAYYPATGRWQMITPRLPADQPSAGVIMAAVPGRLVVWSLWQVVHNYKHGYSIRSGVSVLALTSSGIWHTLAARWPQHQTVSPPTLTSYGFLFGASEIWCGDACSPPSASFPGFFANPVTLARRPIPPGPLGSAEPSYLWTGMAVLAVNLYTEISGQHIHIRPDAMAAWDTASGWLTLPPPPGYPPLAAPPAWTGSALLELTANGQLLSFAR